jgi:hypothetical protein
VPPNQLHRDCGEETDLCVGRPEAAEGLAALGGPLRCKVRDGADRPQAGWPQIGLLRLDLCRSRRAEVAQPMTETPKGDTAELIRFDDFLHFPTIMCTTVVR